MPLTTVAGLKPLFNNVLLKKIVESRKVGGVILPDTARTPLQQATVIAAGPGSYNQAGQLIATSVKEDDKVLFSDFAGHKLSVMGDEYIMVRDSDIIAKLP
ncbi:Chaperonin Cpn10 [Carpediemonas membranifera]|uniref:20 kDa chaperonin, chloroplastic n=1 Tax=Carpediemonas membranifera TaxID=201153 RepID=A0A8J6EBI7_9EUKA|nr:Chaperonin Cpn10 [Carpediemonas membranifera]|eukprot:KAG9397300.1 Chaperonin Cpn10 [Carpediemonas membranifera]